jgi:hypothetical protein
MNLKLFEEFKLEDIKNKTVQTAIEVIIKSKTNVYILRPNIDSSVTLQQTKDMANKFGVRINYFNPVEDHACGVKEPEILKFINNI